MFGLQAPELIIILVIVIVLFGASRLRGIGGALGGSIRVHHTVHPESVATPIPGKTYNDLKRLTPGTHNITVKRSLEPANPVASGSPS